MMSYTGGDSKLPYPVLTHGFQVLIMMSNTGGGHRASAEALKDAFHEKYGNAYEVRGQRPVWLRVAVL